MLYPTLKAFDIKAFTLKAFDLKTFTLNSFGLNALKGLYPQSLSLSLPQVPLSLKAFIICEGLYHCL